MTFGKQKETNRYMSLTVYCNYGCRSYTTVPLGTYPFGWTPNLGFLGNQDCCHRSQCRVNAGLEQPVVVAVNYPQQPAVYVVPYPSPPVVIVDNRDPWDSPPVYTKKLGGGGSKARVVPTHKSDGGFYIKKM
jgi:hypothetical protein